MTRVIGIVGAAHCGSTVLNMMLGQLPGVFGAGETHWLLDRARFPAGMLWPCRIHGDKCSTLTKPLLRLLGSGSGKWWEYIADAANAHTVVSTDKRPAHFDAFGLPSVAVVLYREPQYWVPSWSMKHGVSLEAAARVWRNLYLRVVAWVKERDLPHVRLNWSKVRAEPYSAEALFRLLGLGFSPVMLDYHKREWCHVGGNRNIRSGGLQPEDYDLAVPEFNDMLEILE